MMLFYYNYSFIYSFVKYIHLPLCMIIITLSMCFLSYLYLDANSIKNVPDYYEIVTFINKIYVRSATLIINYLNLLIFF